MSHLRNQKDVDQGTENEQEVEVAATNEPHCRMNHDKIPKRVREFLDCARLEIHSLDGKITCVGLVWGEGKRVRELGFSRRESISILNWLEALSRTS